MVLSVECLTVPFLVLECIKIMLYMKVRYKLLESFRYRVVAQVY